MAQFSNLASAFGSGVEEPETSVPETSFAVQPQLVDDLRNLRTEQQPSEGDIVALRRSQQESLSEHQQFAQSRQQMAGMLQERSADLEVVGGLTRALDPNLSGPARKFAMTGLLRANGVDPKGARDLINLVGSLPENELTAIRSGLVETSATAPPGSMRALVRQIGSGQIGADALLQRISSAAQNRAAREGEEVAQAFNVSDTPQAAGAPRPQNYHVGPQAEEVDPGWSRVLPNLEPGTRYRYDDAQAQGYTLPRGEEGRKALNELTNRQADYLKFQGQANNLHDLVQGRPDALGPIGSAAQYWDSVSSQVNNFNRGALEAATNRAAAPLIAKAPTAEAAAVIRSRVAELGFSYARQLNGPGVLSTQDVDRALTALGDGWSSGQTTAVIRDVSSRQYTALQEFTQRTVGRDDGLAVDRLSIRQLDALAGSEATPQTLRDAAHNRLERMVVERDARRAEAETGTRMQAGKRGDPRTQPTLEAEEAGFRRQADTERRQTQEDRTRRIGREDAADVRAESGEVRANTQLELAIEQFRRQATWRSEDKAEARQQRLQAAVQAFAKAIGASGPRMSVPSGGSGGGGQDSRAFVVPEKKQRRAPDIPNLRRGK